MKSDNDLKIIGHDILLNFPNLRALDLSCDRFALYICMWYSNWLAISSKILQMLGTNSLDLDAWPDWKILLSFHSDFPSKYLLNFCIWYWYNRGKDANDKGLKALVSSITANLTNLRILNLDFSEWNRLTDIVLEEAVGQITRKLVNVHYLTLNFSKYNIVFFLSITFYFSIPHLISQRVLLKFKSYSNVMSSCNRISTVGIERVRNQIANCSRRLKKLTLDFSR